jgi:hypothetical protein
MRQQAVDHGLVPVHRHRDEQHIRALRERALVGGDCDTNARVQHTFRLQWRVEQSLRALSCG